MSGVGVQGRRVRADEPVRAVGVEAVLAGDLALRGCEEIGIGVHPASLASASSGYRRAGATFERASTELSRASLSCAGYLSVFR
jgi:hypothetical protein